MRSLDKDGVSSSDEPPPVHGRYDIAPAVPLSKHVADATPTL